MKKTSSIRPDTEEKQIRQLATAVILRAIGDLRSDKDIALSLDAMIFLTGKDFPLWAEVAGVPFAVFTPDLVPQAWKRIQYH